MPDDTFRTRCDETLAAVCDAHGVVHALLEQTTDAVLIGDLDGRILAWNAAAENLFGWTAAEVIGRVLPPVPEKMHVQAVRFLREIAAAGAPVSHAMQLLRKDGTQVGVDIRLSTLTDVAGNPCAVLSLYSPASDESRFGGTIDRFLTSLSCELISPLTALQGAAELMITSEVSEDAERRERVAKLVRERCRQVSGLVDDLLVVSGLTSTTQPLDVDAVDMTEALARIVRESDAAQRGSVVDLTDSPQRCVVEGDRLRLEQALSTLVSVAIEQARPRRPHAFVYEDAGAAVFEISDPLVGDQDATAQPDAPPAEDVLGPSARLRLVSHVAEMHGGSLTSHMPKRGGFAYTLRLPLCVEAAGA